MEVREILGENRLYSLYTTLQGEREGLTSLQFLAKNLKFLNL
jgi:hypothetical protein